MWTLKPLEFELDAELSHRGVFDVIGDELLFLRAECGCDGLERLGRVASQDKLSFQYRPLAGIFLVASH